MSDHNSDGDKLAQIRRKPFARRCISRPIGSDETPTRTVSVATDRCGMSSRDESKVGSPVSSAPARKCVGQCSLDLESTGNEPCW